VELESLFLLSFFGVSVIFGGSFVFGDSVIGGLVTLGGAGVDLLLSPIIEDVALDSFAGSDMELVIALEDGGIRISIEGEAVTITEDEETDEDADLVGSFGIMIVVIIRPPRATSGTVSPLFSTGAAETRPETTRRTKGRS